jgi:hypothetical protein
MRTRIIRSADYPLTIISHYSLNKEAANNAVQHRILEQNPQYGLLRNNKQNYVYVLCTLASDLQLYSFCEA